MYSSPWLAVAVYARAPVALAPIATDIAANSDSTLTNSQCSRWPAFTSGGEPLDDVRLRSDRVGADHLRAAHRDRLGDGLRALHLPKHGRLLELCSSLRARSGRARTPARPRLRSRRRPSPQTAHGSRRHRAERATSPVRAANPPSRAALGSGLPSCCLASSVAGTVGNGRGQSARTAPRCASRKALGSVDQHPSAGLEPSEHVHLMKQRRIDDDQPIGLGDRLARADRTLVDATERHHRRARPLGAKAREGLRMAPLDECRNRQQLSRRDDTLAAAPVDADLEHRSI